MSDQCLPAIDLRAETEPGQPSPARIRRRKSFAPLPWKAKRRTDAALLEDIKQKLLEFDAEEGELFRGLCRLAKTWHVQPGRFQRLLRKGELPAPRASEIRQVLDHPDLRDSFVRENSRATWKATLAAARRRNPRALHRAVLKFVTCLNARAHLWPDGEAAKDGWLLEREGAGQFRLTHECGKLEVRQQT